MFPSSFVSKAVQTLTVLAMLSCPAAARGQSPCGDWSAVNVPASPGSGLLSVSASSTTDAWAVWQAMYHWNGSHWTKVIAPGVGHPDSVIRSVVAVAEGNAWAVGYTSFLGTPQTLVERWNGTKWIVMPSPTVAGGSNFDAIAAISPNDIWAVGSRAGGYPLATMTTLTAHWNGSSWTQVPAPNVANRSHTLDDVVAIASNDVWAVGSSRDIGGLFRTLIVHWDGSTWSAVPSPNLPGENSLTGVSATSANDVWAVGNAYDGVTSRQLFLHWNGSVWSQVEDASAPNACAGCISDVLAMGPNDVWAAGTDLGHWDGSHWTVVADPQVPGATAMGLRSLSKVGPCEAWSVGGSFDPDFVESPLAIRLSGTPLAVEDGTRTSAIALRVSPNPSRGESVFALTLAEPGVVRVTIHDLGGRIVRDVSSATLPAGEHVFRWDGRDGAGRATEPGMYFVTATSGARSVGAQLVRVR